MPKPVKAKPAAIKAGRLRERVKSGELDPREVLRWLRKQPAQNPEFVRWLQGRVT